MLPHDLVQTLEGRGEAPSVTATVEAEQAAAGGSSYLEGAAVALEGTAHLSLGTLVLMAGELQQQTHT